jgi:hypothetical protein
VGENVDSKGHLMTVLAGLVLGHEDARIVDQAIDARHQALDLSAITLPNYFTVNDNSDSKFLEVLSAYGFKSKKGTGMYYLRTLVATGT